MALSDLPRLAWPGRYSDGRTAAFRTVDAAITGDGLAIRPAGDARPELWPFDDIRVVDGPDASGTVRLAPLGSDARLTLQHRDAMTALALRCPKLHDGMGGESSWRVIAAWCGAAAAAVGLMIFAIIPFLAQHASAWVSPRLEAELGERLVGVVIALTAPAETRDRAECDAPRGLAALAKLAAPLEAQLSLRNPPHLRVIDSPMINALALPGGQILLFRGLIDFAQSPNEIAGVIAHELGHEKLDHPMSLVIRESGTAFVIGLILGDIFGGSAVALAGAGLVDTAFTRDAEAAADAQAVALMTKAGFDLRPFAAFFNRLEAEQGDQDLPIAFLRTHPPNQQRAAMIAAAPSGGGPALTPADWADLQKICGPASAQKKAAP